MIVVVYMFSAYTEKSDQGGQTFKAGALQALYFLLQEVVVRAVAIARKAAASLSSLLLAIS